MVPTYAKSKGLMGVQVVLKINGVHYYSVICYTNIKSRDTLTLSLDTKPQVH